MGLSPVTETFQNDDPSWLGSAHGTDSTQTGTLLVSAFTAITHYPNGYIPSGTPLGEIASGVNAGMYGPYAGRTSEIQTATVTGVPTGGTFTLTLAGETTAAIAFNATAAVVRVALEALSNVNAGDVTVAGGAGGPYTVAFGGKFAGDNVPAFTASSSLTGGTSPGVTIATTTGGGPVASDGSEVMAGHLYKPVKVAVGDLTEPCAVLWHGRVKTARLPFPVDSAGQRDVRGRINYV